MWRTRQFQGAFDCDTVQGETGTGAIGTTHSKTQQKAQQAAFLEKKIENIQKQQIAVQKVEQIEPHAVPFSSKVMLDRSEYENLAAAAKKFYVQERKKSNIKQKWSQSKFVDLCAILWYTITQVHN